ncbi:Indole-3-glycerol phosphate synthase, chloroplastic [Dichanthelium oligosanthes]|uniref:indole-3-glycerol-phosphate synthase n=1 Tax=Dichanthelium oligosanthes TaxID=888268 RepID=A0A1E5VND5_9POAL|nr:Indole-3-glycerol phosphate synthase, chloroplastic [Dichanthelium oligosanthes]
MQSSILAAASASRASVPATVFSPLSATSRPVLRTGDIAGACPAARAVRCSAAEGSVLYRLDDGMFNSSEVIQWESGKSINAIAAAQGIRIRRRCRPRYPSEGVGADRAVPRNILEQIIWDKEVEVSQRKAKTPLHKVMESAEHAPSPKDFIGALDVARRRNGLPALIAEVKKASPSKGLLREHFNPVEIAHAYEKNGAACLSILTDEKHFQGSFENLETVRNSGVNCPLLCKEFVIDVWQIYYARSKGADAVLLIAAVLPDLDIKYMLRVCRSLGMAALVEVHDERELDRVLKINGVQLIGINNRSLGTFELDTANTKMLLEKRGDIIRKKQIQVVSESGLFTPNDIAYVQNAGVSAVLVGESLLTQEDPGRAIAGLFGKELLH